MKASLPGSLHLKMMQFLSLAALSLLEMLDDVIR